MNKPLYDRDFYAWTQAQAEAIDAVFATAYRVARWRALRETRFSDHRIPEAIPFALPEALTADLDA